VIPIRDSRRLNFAEFRKRSAMAEFFSARAKRNSPSSQDHQLPRSRPARGSRRAGTHFLSAAFAFRVFPVSSGLPLAPSVTFTDRSATPSWKHLNSQSHCTWLVSPSCTCTRHTYIYIYIYIYNYHSARATREIAPSPRHRELSSRSD